MTNHFLYIVLPSTVVRWVRVYIKNLWSFKSWYGKFRLLISGKRKAKTGRKLMKRELIALIQEIKLKNFSWGALKIQMEIRNMGYRVSRPTILKYMRELFPLHDPDGKIRANWRSLVCDIKEGVVSCDFFQVISFYGTPVFFFFIIEHVSRNIIYARATRYPNPLFVTQSFRHAFEEDSPRFLIMDNDKNFSPDVEYTLSKTMGVEVIRTAYHSPWQNPVAERWVKTAKHEFFDHRIVFNERQAQKLLNQFVEYYNNHRAHSTLNGNSPAGNIVQRTKPANNEKIVSVSHCNGLFHHFVYRSSA